jgi:hypothetical protein
VFCKPDAPIVLALRGLPEGATVTLRTRSNAVLHGPQPPRTGKRGRPPLQGDRLGSLTELVAAGGFSEVQMAAGRSAVKQVIGQWYSVFGPQAVQVVLARRPDHADGFDIALVSTDLSATPAELLERYGRRWTIETAFQDAKSTVGVGQARNRTPQAVARTVPISTRRPPAPTTSSSRCAARSSAPKVPAHRAGLSAPEVGVRASGRRTSAAVSDDALTPAAGRSRAS